MTNDEIIAKFYEAVQSGDYQSFLDTVLHTQYIGARYVPLFADPLQWSAATAYEPLTIVTNQGNSYTSRQYVPTGIDIANTDYWALTGNYNAQVEQYRQEVLGFNERITALENENTEARQKKYIIAFGDSWVNPNGGYYFQWLEMLANKLNLNSKNFGDGGAFIGGEEGSGTSVAVIDQINEAIADSDLTADNVEYVVMIAGVNDFANDNLNAANYASRCLTLYNKIQVAYPNAKIMHFQNMCLNHQSNDASNIRRCYTFFRNIATIMQRLADTGIYSLSLYKAIANVNNYGSDYLHPNQLCNQIIAGQIYSYINGIDNFPTGFYAGQGCGIRVLKNIIYFIPTETEDANLVNPTFRTYAMICNSQIFSNSIPVIGDKGTFLVEYAQTNNATAPVVTISNDAQNLYGQTAY